MAVRSDTSDPRGDFVACVHHRVDRLDHVRNGADRLERLRPQRTADQRFELNDQVDGVDAVDVEIFAQPGVQPNAVRLDVEGVVQNGGDTLQQLFPGHGGRPGYWRWAATKAHNDCTLKKWRRACSESADKVTP